MVGPILREATVLLIFCHVFIQGSDLLEIFRPNPTFPEELNKWLESVQRHKSDFGLIREVAKIKSSRVARNFQQQEKKSNGKNAYTSSNYDEDESKIDNDKLEEAPKNKAYPYRIKHEDSSDLDSDQSDESDIFESKTVRNAVRLRRNLDDLNILNDMDPIQINAKSKVGEIKRSDSKYPDRYINNNAEFLEENKNYEIPEIMEGTNIRKKKTVTGGNNKEKREIEIDVKSDGKLVKQIKEDDRDPKSIVLNIQSLEEAKYPVNLDQNVKFFEPIQSNKIVNNLKPSIHSQYSEERSISPESIQKNKEFFYNYNNLLSANEHLNTDGSLAHDGLDSALVYHVTMPNIDGFRGITYSNKNFQPNVASQQNRNGLRLNSIASVQRENNFNRNGLQDMSHFWTLSEKNQMRKGIEFARRNELLKRLPQSLEGVVFKNRDLSEKEAGFEPAESIVIDNNNEVKKESAQPTSNNFLSKEKSNGINNINYNKPAEFKPDNKRQLNPSEEKIQLFNDGPDYNQDKILLDNLVGSSIYKASAMQNEGFDESLDSDNKDDKDADEQNQTPLEIGCGMDTTTIFVFMKPLTDDKEMDGDISPDVPVKDLPVSNSVECNIGGGNFSEGVNDNPVKEIESSVKDNAASFVPENRDPLKSESASVKMIEIMEDTPSNAQLVDLDENSNREQNNDQIVEEDKDRFKENKEIVAAPVDKTVVGVEDKKIPTNSQANHFHKNLGAVRKIADAESVSNEEVQPVSVSEIKKRPLVTQKENKGIAVQNVRNALSKFKSSEAKAKLLAKLSKKKKQQNLIHNAIQLMKKSFKPREKLSLKNENVFVISKIEENAKNRNYIANPMYRSDVLRTHQFANPDEFESEFAENNLAKSPNLELQFPSRNRQFPAQLLSRRKIYLERRSDLNNKKHKRNNRRQNRIARYFPNRNSALGAAKNVMANSKNHRNIKPDSPRAYIRRKLQSIESEYDVNFVGPEKETLTEVTTNVSSIRDVHEELLHKDSVEGDYGDEEDALAAKQQSKKFNIVKKTDNEFANPITTSEHDDEYYNDDYLVNNSHYDNIAEDDQRAGKEYKKDENKPAKEYFKVSPSERAHTQENVRNANEQETEKAISLDNRSRKSLQSSQQPRDQHSKKSPVVNNIRPPRSNSYLDKSVFQHLPNFVISDQVNEEKLRKRSLEKKTIYPRGYNFPLAASGFFVKPSKRKANDFQKDKQVRETADISGDEKPLASERSTISDGNDFSSKPLSVGDVDKPLLKDNRPSEPSVIRDRSSLEDECQKPVNVSGLCEENEQNFTTVTVTTVLPIAYENQTQSVSGEAAAESFEKLDDILDGDLPIKLVNNAFDRLRSNKKIHRRFQAGLRMKKVKFMKMTGNDTDKARMLIAKMAQIMNSLQLITMCQSLPHNMVAYLKSITSVPKGDSLAKTRTMEEVAYDDTQNKVPYIFESRHSSHDSLQEKVKVLKELLVKYNHLSPPCKQRAEPVKEYIENHLGLLRDMVDNDSSPNNNATKTVQSRSNDDQRKPYQSDDSLIQAQLDSVGLGKEQKFKPKFDLEKIIESNRHEYHRTEQAVTERKRTASMHKRDLPNSVRFKKYNKLYDAVNSMRLRRENEERLAKMFGLSDVNHNNRISKRNAPNVAKTYFESPVVYSL